MATKKRMTTDHKPKKVMKGLQGSATMKGPEKLLAASKKQIGPAKQTASKRIDQNKPMKKKKVMY
jgi:hypothetical protein